MARKPTPKWGFEASPTIESFRFNEDQKQEILNTLGTIKSQDKLDIFITDLEKQLSEFIAYERIEKERPRRSEILAAFNELDSYAEMFSARLRALDSESKKILGPLLPPSLIDDHDDDSGGHNYLSSLARALDKFRDSIHFQNKNMDFLLPSAAGGQPKHQVRRALAHNVALILWILTDDPPTTSRGGLFESILFICLTAATGEDIKDIHELVCDAVKKLKEEQPPP